MQTDCELIQDLIFIIIFLIFLLPLSFHLPFGINDRERESEEDSMKTSNCFVLFCLQIETCDHKWFRFLLRAAARAIKIFDDDNSIFNVSLWSSVLVESLNFLSLAITLDICFSLIDRPSNEHKNSNTIYTKPEHNQLSSACFLFSFLFSLSSSAGVSGS